MQKNRQQLLQ